MHLDVRTHFIIFFMVVYIKEKFAIHFNNQFFWCIDDTFDAREIICTTSTFIDTGHTWQPLWGILISIFKIIYEIINYLT